MTILCGTYLGAKLVNRTEITQTCGLASGHTGRHGLPVNSDTSSGTVPAHALDSIRWRTQAVALGFDLGKLSRG